MKCILILLIVGFLCYSLVNTNIQVPEKLDIEIFDRFIYNFLKRFLLFCDRRLKKIVLYDYRNDTPALNVLLSLQPKISVSLFTQHYKWIELGDRFDGLKVDAIIIVIETQNALDIMNNLFSFWKYNRDCMVYIFQTPINDCDKYETILEYSMRYYFSKAYFICLENNRYTYVYTRDLYGDNGPPKWQKINQGLLWGKNGTFYKRSYEKDIRRLCPGFNFKRTDPSKQSFVVVGVRNAQIQKDSNFSGTEEMLFNDEIEESLTRTAKNNVYNLKKLLNRRFLYYKFDPSSKELILQRSYFRSGIDTLVLLRYLVVPRSIWKPFYPVGYERVTIISHASGVMTPLEKIFKFYGMWTLSSLTVMLILTFIVIWWVTRSVSLAAFDVIRLLINTEILVPINTRVLKIFFSMTFLYFLIIHATFSGNLAKFLTSVDYRHNIDTIEDLKDTRIQVIYNFGYNYESTEEFDVLRQKTRFILNSRGCIIIINNTNSACIAPLESIKALHVLENYTYNAFHISKTEFGSYYVASLYRPGFPLLEEFNWAHMHLFDTGIIRRQQHLRAHRSMRKNAEQFALSRADFRNITRQDLLFAFLFLIIGNCVGFICFLGEIICNLISKILKNRRHQKGTNILCTRKHFHR